MNIEILVNTHYVRKRNVRIKHEGYLQSGKWHMANTARVESSWHGYKAVVFKI